MEFVWHPSDYSHSRVLECQPPHGLGEWVVFHHVGAGAGVLEVQVGPSTTPPPEIAAILRVENTWRVICDPKGFYIITVFDESPQLWQRLEGLIIQAIVEAREKANGAG